MNFLWKDAHNRGAKMQDPMMGVGSCNHPMCSCVQYICRTGGSIGAGCVGEPIIDSNFSTRSGGFPDLHLVHCLVCNLASCEGTMQALDVRHWELFLNEEYRTRELKFEQVYTRHVAGHCNEAAVCIFDANQLRSKNMQEVLSLSRWVAAPGQWQPKGVTASFDVAACTNLRPNKGLRVKLLTMNVGGPVVGIRFCQELA